MNEHKRLQDAISLSLTAGYHLDAEAFSLLTAISKTGDPLKLVEAALEKLEALAEKPLCITKALLEESAQETFPDVEKADPLVFSSFAEAFPTSRKGKSSFYAHAKDIEKDVEVLEDSTSRVHSTGSVDDFLEYFRDRFKRMRRLLRQRMDCRGTVSLKDVSSIAARSRAKVVCMVRETRESQRGVFLEIEDLESNTVAFIPFNTTPKLLEKAKLLLPDQVVCLCLLKGKEGLLIVEDIFFPDIPQKKPKSAKDPVHVALISDLHVGSTEFMAEEFGRFLLWLNGKYNDQNLKRIAGSVKYVVIAGDIVDGVGIYPNQIRELNVHDVSKQYRLAAKFIEQIPDYIEVIIIPGNHDASRKALPQPALPKEYTRILSESREVLSLGNPASLSIHGVDFLLYHGRSLDDVLATAADMDFHSPERAMKLLLRSRHLAPTYGQRTSIAPEKRDYLVIERVPDIFHAGHVHVMKHEFYRGTLMVNSGAWQRQTGYQRKLGLEPTPGIIPVVNLQTLEVSPMDFS